MGSSADQSAFLAAHARQLQHCPRMHLTALRLPCGEREECVAGSRCPVIAGGEPALPKPEDAPSHGAAVLRKAVVDSGLTLKAFCKRHGICPRKELDDATALSARGIHRTPRKRCW